MTCRSRIPAPPHALPPERHPHPRAPAEEEEVLGHHLHRRGALQGQEVHGAPPGAGHVQPRLRGHVPGRHGQQEQGGASHRHTSQRIREPAQVRVQRRPSPAEHRGRHDDRVRRQEVRPAAPAGAVLLLPGGQRERQERVPDLRVRAVRGRPPPHLPLPQHHGPADLPRAHLAQLSHGAAQHRRAGRQPRIPQPLLRVHRLHLPGAVGGGRVQAPQDTGRRGQRPAGAREPPALHPLPGHVARRVRQGPRQRGPTHPG
ncbi:hypothetical protein CEXT_451891 [Caerostris extrusa]|uniref:Uncharacterized protein n=1 Tax=Caerostris extrusa TaxID=172846 RepID=A0AAV4PA86_CAEEX|nr:hypothetical protein CEXT_451891 [Caerostris extrusa]